VPVNTTEQGSHFGGQSSWASLAWAALAAALLAGGAWAWATTSRALTGGAAEAGVSTKPAQRTPAPAERRVAGSPACPEGPCSTRGPGAGYWIRLGPTRDLKTLSRTAGRLSERYGILGRVQTTWAVAAYRVVSGPVRLRKAAEERRRVLAVSGLAAEVREQADGYVLDFGVFQDAAAAESVARAVRSRGYGTSVEPVRTPVYTLTVGPLPERAVLAVARTLREAGAEFTVVSGR